MEDFICPECDCFIGTNAYTKEGVVYCCKPCATVSECECGCCERVDTEQVKEEDTSEEG